MFALGSCLGIDDLKQRHSLYPCIILNLCIVFQIKAVCNHPQQRRYFRSPPS